ncbi:MAG: PilZ domain-containing protein, partial [Terracidiphilus sp.]
MEAVEKAEAPGTGPVAGDRDRRASARFPVEEETRIFLIKHGVTLRCHILDISLTGCRIRAAERFPSGAMLRVEIGFRMRGFDFRLGGITQWTDGRNQAGIRFVEISERRRQDLREALGEVEEVCREKTEKAA